MRTLLSTSKLVTIVLASGFFMSARAGVVIEMSERGSRGPQASVLQKLYVQNGNARIESLDSSGRLAGLMFFKNDSLIMVEQSEKAYYVIDRPAIAQIAKSMNASMNQMQAELSRLPPEQRAMMEQMMGKMGGGSAMPAPAKAAAAPQFRNTGQGSKVAGQSCTIWEMSESGSVAQQLCVVPMKSVPGHRELMTVMERMSKLMLEFRKAMPQMPVASSGLETTSDVNGFPVLMKDYQGGRPTGREVELVKWAEQNIPASLFEIPAGYRQRDLVKEMQRGSR